MTLAIVAFVTFFLGYIIGRTDTPLTSCYTDTGCEEPCAQCDDGGPCVCADQIEEERILNGN